MMNTVICNKDFSLFQRPQGSNEVVVEEETLETDTEEVEGPSEVVAVVVEEDLIDFKLISLFSGFFITLNLKKYIY